MYGFAGTIKAFDEEVYVLTQPGIIGALETGPIHPTLKSARSCR
jgi:hypothetical protein